MPFNPEYVRNCSNIMLGLFHSAYFDYFVPKHLGRLLSYSSVA